MNVKRLLGFAAIGGLLVVGAPAQQAHAMSLNNPSVAAAIQGETASGTTEVRWRRYYRRNYGYRRHYWRRRW